MTTAAPPLSIRDRIRAIQTQTILGEVSPAVVRDHLITLTGLYGSVMDEHREADAALHVIEVGYVVTDGDSVNRAELRATVTPEYARAREAHDTEKFTLEFIRSAKVYLQSLDTEMRLAR